MSVAQRRINKISKSNSRKDFVELLAKREQVGMGRLRLMERRQVNKWQGSEGGCHFEGGEDSFSLSDGLSTLVHVLYQNSSQGLLSNCFFRMMMQVDKEEKSTAYLDMQNT